MEQHRSLSRWVEQNRIKGAFTLYKYKSVLGSQDIILACPCRVAYIYIHVYRLGGGGGKGGYNHYHL